MDQYFNKKQGNTLWPIFMQSQFFKKIIFLNDFLHEWTRITHLI